MSASVTHIDEARGGKPLSASERLECLLLAQMNEEKAAMCSANQPGIRKFFEMNAQLLHRVAKR